MVSLPVSSLRLILGFEKTVFPDGIFVTGIAFGYRRLGIAVWVSPFWYRRLGIAVGYRRWVLSLGAGGVFEMRAS